MLARLVFIALATTGCGLFDSGNDTPPRIIYTALPGVREDIQVYGADEEGKHRRKLTDSPGEKAEPTWSPDGGRIAFAWETQSQSLIYVMNADGSNPVQLTPTPGPPASAAYDAPEWAPDGRQIAFGTIGGGAIWVINADGSGQRRLTPTSVVADDPAWSPDGARIAFWGIENSPSSLGAEIYLIDVDGSNLVNLTHTLTGETTPAWSPDGTLIAFSNSAGGSPLQLNVMRPTGTEARRVMTLTDGRWAVQARWSPDGSRIAFSGRDGLWTVRLDGTDLRHIVNDRLAADPDWR